MYTKPVIGLPHPRHAYVLYTQGELVMSEYPPALSLYDVEQIQLEIHMEIV